MFIKKQSQFVKIVTASHDCQSRRGGSVGRFRTYRILLFMFSIISVGISCKVDAQCSFKVSEELLPPDPKTKELIKPFIYKERNGGTYCEGFFGQRESSANRGLVVLRWFGNSLSFEPLATDSLYISTTLKDDSNTVELSLLTPNDISYRLDAQFTTAELPFLWPLEVLVKGLELLKKSPENVTQIGRTFRALEQTDTIYYPCIIRTAKTQELTLQDTTTQESLLLQFETEVLYDSVDYIFRCNQQSTAVAKCTSINGAKFVISVPDNIKGRVRLELFLREVDRHTSYQETYTLNLRAD